MFFKDLIKPKTVFISGGKEWMELKITERDCIFFFPKEHIYVLIE